MNSHYANQHFNKEEEGGSERRRGRKKRRKEGRDGREGRGKEEELSNLNNSG